MGAREKTIKVSRERKECRRKKKEVGEIRGPGARLNLKTEGRRTKRKEKTRGSERRREKGGKRKHQGSRRGRGGGENEREKGVTKPLGLRGQQG